MIRTNHELWRWYSSHALRLLDNEDNAESED